MLNVFYMELQVLVLRHGFAYTYCMNTQHHAGAAHTAACVILLLGVFAASGCMQKTMRLDLDTYVGNTAAYAGQDIVITATLEDVLARYSLYANKKIEVTAPVRYYRSYGFWTWHIMLEENGKQLRCYTHHYRVEAGRDAVLLLDRAIHGKQAVTVTGIVKKDGIDILLLSCDGASATPSFKPARPAMGRWPVW